MQLIGAVYGSAFAVDWKFFVNNFCDAQQFQYSLVRILERIAVFFHACPSDS